MKISAKNIDIEVREGTTEDVPLILSFIKAMARFEKLEVTADEETLRRSLFGDDPAARTLLVFSDGEPVAYVVYFFTFSTMVGKRSLYLEDLYVDPPFRGKGIARALMAYLAGLAAENDCGRFEWTVLDWNSHAIEFYEGLGAGMLDDWRICRLDGDRIEKLAGELVSADE